MKNTQRKFNEDSVKESYRNMRFDLDKDGKAKVGSTKIIADRK
jgi:hypothetical protein